MTTSISPLKEMIFAVRAASEKVAGDFWRLAQGGGGVEAKGDRNGMPDYVTQTDRAAEGIIQRVLAQVFPSIPFVGEESGGSHEDHRRFFLVDPLDGTSNFVALREYFSVCAAYVEDGEVHAAVVADPMRGHVYSAEKGRGAFLSGLTGGEGARLSVSTSDVLKQTQIECEYPFRSQNEMAVVGKLISHVSGLRKSGSTALDLCHLARGQKMCVLSSGLAPHDLAAAFLIAQESGAVISDPNGDAGVYHSCSIVAGSPAIHAQVMDLLRK